MKLVVKEEQLAASLADMANRLIDSPEGGGFSVIFKPSGTSDQVSANVIALNAAKVTVVLGKTRPAIQDTVAVWCRHIRHAVGLTRHGRIDAQYEPSGQRMIELIAVTNLRRELK